LACLAVATYYTAVPINTSGGPKQFKSDAMVASPQAIMVLESDIDSLGLREPWVAAANIKILLVEQNLQSTFSVRTLHKSTSPSLQLQHSTNSAEDFALMLLTSGTSGTKKLVPVTTSSLMIGICCVIDSWGLSSEDTCLNMMPLNHV
jgi:long-subunit acyl-CoA synthetase (AMP-forming)